MPDPKPPSAGELAAQIRWHDERCVHRLVGETVQEAMAVEAARLAYLFENRLRIATALESVAEKDARIAELEAWVRANGKCSGCGGDGLAGSAYGTVHCSRCAGTGLSASARAVLGEEGRRT